MAELNIGFLTSHGGSNLQAVVDACKNGGLQAKPCVVISNNSGSVALERARVEGIPYYHLSQIAYPQAEELDHQIVAALNKHGVNLILLLGYMKKLGPLVLREFSGRILNIHPSLLPKYGGQGMYGRFVHEAVLKSGDEETGITIHLVDEEYDTGAIVNQCSLPVHKSDTIETLSARVLEAEHEFLVETLVKMSRGA